MIERTRDFSHDLDFLYKEAQEARTDSLKSFINLEALTDKHAYSDKVLINEGGQKLIYKCLDLRTDREVARAELSPDSSPEDQYSFLREARLMARLQHPNIMPIYDIGMEDNQPYFTMKLVDENSFDDLLKKGGDLRELLEIYLKVCDAITYAHSKGVIHRDLKPANIQVSNFNEVLVCDWGSAQILPGSIMESEVGQLSKPLTKGSPGYMAPEQSSSDTPSASQDIYTLGAILYQILSRKAPVSGTNIKPSEINTEIPSGLEAVCLKSMAIKPEDRYQNVDQITKEIKAWLSGFAPQAEQASLRKQLKLMLIRHK
ncbi:MAG: serine/threonine protein kinase, partial [Lentisphaeraceae bacterium]|nr:serine/threonine protein kinase [Lentisphaeraceae bacterium]